MTGTLVVNSKVPNFIGKWEELDTRSASWEYIYTTYSIHDLKYTITREREREMPT